MKQVFVVAIIMLLFSGHLYGRVNPDKMEWWREARFGMFIHWGLYSQCEGYWQGEPVDGIGEWILKIGEVPVDEYRELASSFTAENYDPEKWVLLAKQAGMKYIVITAKHHDGFALFESDVDSFNVVDATPYGKDLIGEFVAACNKHDMRIGFYYSQYQDWTYPGAGGNTWEPGYAYSKEGFKEYMKKKALPQVREILSNYGQIDMIWFDTPGLMTEEESQTFLDLARELQPDIIVSGRLGNEVGDYVQEEDNNLPKRRQDFDWEVPVTMNHTWAFKRDDQNWKSTEYLLWQLTYATAMGGNYLLNIGPRADGTVPEASVERLEAIGSWMSINREVVQGAQTSPFLNYFTWGSITRRPGKLYLNISQWPEDEFSLYGLNNKVKRAYFLSNNREITHNKSNNYLVLDLPDEPQDPYLTVVVLEIEGEPDVQDELVQNKEGLICLESALARNTTGRPIHMGAPRQWTKATGSLSWDYKVTRPGRYKLEVITTGHKHMAWPERPAAWDGDHKILIRMDKQIIEGIVDRDRVEAAPRDLYNDFKVAEIAVVEIPTAGMHTLELTPEIINSENYAGLAVRMVRLSPVTD